MKKLMIAAAAAAMIGGVYAADKGFCDGPEVELPECSVYDVKLKVKTLAPKAAAVKVDCDDDTCVAYYKSATRTFDGIIWLCEGSCEDFKDGYNIVMWEKANKIPALGLLQYDETNKWTSTAQVEFDVLNRFDKKANKVQAAALLSLDGGDGVDYSLTGEVSIAGFGTFDTKAGIVKSISGNAAGSLTALSAITLKCCDATAKVVALCEEFEDYEFDGDEDDLVAASGTWSIKYNKSLSNGKKTAPQVVPAYAHAQ